MEASQHRLRARDALRGNWLTAVLVAFVFSLLCSGGNGGVNININLSDSNIHSIQDVFTNINLSAQQQGFLTAIFGFSAAMVALLSIVITIVHLILGGVMQLGSARYNLNLIDRRDPQFADLFSQFYRFSQALVMNLLTSLFTFLWSLLFIIPGIVTSYSYAMAPYILLEDPNCTGSEAIQRSKAMMQGHKGELFWLDLTFIGWEILSSLTLGIGSLFLNPYKAASRASFYRYLQDLGYRTVEY